MKLRSFASCLGIKAASAAFFLLSTFFLIPKQRGTLELFTCNSYHNTA